jgi:hypothetical protein
MMYQMDNFVKFQKSKRTVLANTILDTTRRSVHHASRRVQLFPVNSVLNILFLLGFVHTIELTLLLSLSPFLLALFNPYTD